MTRSQWMDEIRPQQLITSNVLIAHELLHSFQIMNLTQPYMAFKLDISKAFDKVEWRYIEAVMKRLGFSERWCDWIMKCITTISYSIHANGSLDGNILIQRGNQQGDPISPYLYLLYSEGLLALIRSRIQQGRLDGFKASRNGPPISHLLFADDSLLFCKATADECTTLIHILNKYVEVSGQQVNFQKSAVTFGKGLSPQQKNDLTHIMGVTKISGFGKYLGLPEFIGRNKYNTFSFLHQRILHKLES